MLVSALSHIQKLKRKKCLYTWSLYDIISTNDLSVKKNEKKDIYQCFLKSFIHWKWKKNKTLLNWNYTCVGQVCWDGLKWSFLCTHVFWNMTLKRLALGRGGSFSTFVSGLDLGFLFAWVHSIRWK